MAAQNDGSAGTRDDDPGASPDQHDVPLIQWVVSGVAVAVVLGSFGIIAYDGFVAHRGPPAFSVVVDSIARMGELHRVHVSVRNDGGTPATYVQVSGAVQTSTSPPALVQFDYLAAGSREAAVLVFDEDPAAGLKVRVESWTQP